MHYHPSDTAVVIIDPQNDVLSPTGRNWEVLADSIGENNTVEHLVELLEAARMGGYSLFVSPHYFYPADHRGCSTGPWKPTNCGPTPSRGPAH
jgi:nicotinamidase-related amidase